MTMRKLYVTLALSILFVPGLVHAQTAEDALRFSQRQPLSSPSLMASAGTGIAGMGAVGDLFRNPAGLGLLSGTVGSLSMNLYDVGDEAVYRVGSLRSPSEDDVVDNRLGHLAYAYKFPTRRGSLVFAAGFAQQTSYSRNLFFQGENGLNSVTDFFMPLSSEFDLMEDDQGVFPEFTRPLSFLAFETYAIDLDQDAVDAGDPVPFLPAVSTGTVLQTGVVTEEGHISELSFGGAVEASKGVMVGVSVNIPFGTYKYYRDLQEDDIYDDNDGFEGTTDFEYLQLTETYESNLVGLNMRAGLTAEVSRGINVGLMVETPTIYSIDEDFDTILFTAFDNGDQYEYGAASNEDAGRGSFEYELLTPWRLGAGISFKRGGLGLAADIEHVNWSQMELSADGYSFAEQNQDISRFYDAVTNSSFTASYRFGDLTVRGGWAIQPDPRSTQVSGGLDRERLFASGGLSYAFNRQFTMDLAWTNERFDDQYMPYFDVESAPVVDEEVSRSFVTIGARFKL